MTYGSKLSIEGLAQNINSDFTTETQKARGIYTWIANNIDYDVKKFIRFEKNSRKRSSKKWKNHYKYELSVSRKTFRKKKGICGDYSILYKHLCDLCNLECVVVSGNSKTSKKEIGKKFGGKHAWNAIHINGEWKLIDVTWSAGTVDDKTQLFTRNFNDNYFFTDPDFFFLKHFPKKQKWLLTDKTKEDFKKLPLFSSKIRQFNYQTDNLNEGILYAENQVVELKFNNQLQDSMISYKFDKEENAYYASLEKEDDYIRIRIDYKKRSSDYLNLFIDGKYYATYKVKPK